VGIAFDAVGGPGDGIALLGAAVAVPAAVALVLLIADATRPAA
jgi:hypothetical protein